MAKLKSFKFKLTTDFDKEKWEKGFDQLTEDMHKLIDAFNRNMEDVATIHGKIEGDSDE